MTITANTFPLNTPIIIESFIDGACGWEFDAPLHIMVPFHAYAEVGSNCAAVVGAKVEDILIDVACDIEFGTAAIEDNHYWPYKDRAAARRRFIRARDGGKRPQHGLAYYKHELVIRDFKVLDYTCKLLTERFG